MPRFYFDVRDGAKFTPNDEGLVCASLDAAERMAAETAEIGRELLPRGDVSGAPPSGARAPARVKNTDPQLRIIAGMEHAANVILRQLDRKVFCRK